MPHLGVHTHPPAVPGLRLQLWDKAYTQEDWNLQKIYTCHQTVWQKPKSDESQIQSIHWALCAKGFRPTEKMLLELHFVHRINLDKSQKMARVLCNNLNNHKETKIILYFHQALVDNQVLSEKEGRRWKIHHKPKSCLQNNHMPSFIAQRTFHTWWSGAFQVSVDITTWSQGKTCFLIWKLYLKCTTNTSYLIYSRKYKKLSFR